MPASRPWILKPWQDFVLFVGTPVLILPCMLVAERLWSGKSLYAVVMAFGALGHHLPGMMRAYGDRSLFARFRTRFIAAPIFLVALCVAFAVGGGSQDPIILITYVWGVWHGLMQTHGFLRMYDSKVGSIDSRTARLDQWMCITWFGAGVIFSTSRLHHVLQKFYSSGGPLVPFQVVEGLQLAWGTLTALVTLAFLANLVHAWRSSRPPSPVKLALLATTFGFWWYANVVVDNILVGIVLFEIFHDVQYLAIVWTFNRRRVQTDPGVGRFTRFVFRDRRPWILLYVGLVFAYGALSLHPKLPSETLNAMFTAVLAASTLLHFYYDSFIWKLSEKPTRAALGIEAGDTSPKQVPRTAWPAPRHQRRPAWVPMGLRWATLVVPAGFLALTQAQPRTSQDDAMRSLGKAFPDYPLAQNNLATYSMLHEDCDTAVQISRRVLAAGRHDRDLEAQARYNLFWGLVGAATNRMQQEQTGAAEALLREASALNPGLARLLEARAIDASRNGDHKDAIVHYTMTLLVSPAEARLHLDLARELYAERRLDEAIEHTVRARQLMPSDPEPRRLLAALQAAKESGS